MTPYTDFLYFGVLLYPILPALVLGLMARSLRWWILIATAGMLAVHYSDRVSLFHAATGGATLSHLPSGLSQPVPLFCCVAAYGLFQYLVARSFFALRARGRRPWVFYLAVLLAIAPLVCVRLLPATALHSLFGFVGISYLTFRSVDAVIGVQDGLITSLPPGQYLAYLMFFPTISSGPVDRYRRFATDWSRTRTRSEFLADLDKGVHRIFTGFLYKFILAYLVKTRWMDPAAGGTGAFPMVSYMYAYSAYLFFDFAGYSAFAVGVSHLLGIHCPENFDRPFLAGNIKDFWNRWHISLSTWFRDHIYMRFLMTARKGGWFRGKYTASYIGFYLLFVLMGIWHGFAPHYLVYGFYHGTLFVAHDLISRAARTRGWTETRAWRIASVVTTFNLVCFGLLLFSGHLFH